MNSAFPIHIRLTTGFDDLACSPACWQAVLARGGTNTLFQTREWLSSWWETLGKGTLLLIVAETDSETVSIAPLYSVDGMVYFLGSGESDYLDLLGDPSPEMLAAMLKVAHDATADFIGFKFYLVPSASPANSRLQQAAAMIGLELTQHLEEPAYEVDLRTHAEAIRVSTRRSMLKREDFFRKQGEFAVTTFRTAAEIQPQLNELFAMHINRWAGKDYRSPYELPEQRAFIERVADVTAERGWLRLLRIDWQGKPLGLGLAWYYADTHYSGPWSFDIAHAKLCPGHVMLRNMLLLAMAEGVSIYDVRGGDDHYKDRLPTRTTTTATWGLYP
ncbi:hypothetical protein BH11PLA2_BH11PLA2_17720 [soil metagenome]